MSGREIIYHSSALVPARLGSRLTIRVGEVVEPTPLEVWLTARWGAHTRKAGRTWWMPVEHKPWQLRAALLELDDDLLDASGRDHYERSSPPLRSYGHRVSDPVSTNPRQSAPTDGGVSRRMARRRAPLRSSYEAYASISQRETPQFVARSVM